MGHDHPHSHAVSGFGKAFAIGIALNTGFVAVEAWYGWQTGSLALLADAGHNLSDVGGLLLAWAAFAAARLHPTPQRSYGWRRGSILASFTNAIILLVAMGSLAWESVQRLQSPAPIEAGTVMAVAAIGVLVNAVTAWLFMAGSKRDLNLRGAFLHMAADALVSGGVVLAGALYLWQGWTWIDPVVSLLIAVIIVAGTWSLLRKSLHLLFDGVPEGLDSASIQRHLLAIPDVLSVHDLHVWALSTTDTALSAHVVITGENRDAVLSQATQVLHHEFHIHHTVLQLESADFAQECHSRSCTV